MRSRSIVTAVVIALLLSLVGCGDEERKKSTADDDRVDEYHATVEAPRIEVLGAGSAPRRRLLLDVEVGQIETTSMTMRQKQAFGDAPPVASPAMTLTYRTEVRAVEADRIEADIAYGDARVDGRGEEPAVVDQLESALEPLAGMRGSVAFSPTGEALEQSFELPDGAPELMRSMVTQFADQATALMVPFPDEEVGEGAEWTATTTLELNGIEMEQTVRYSLDELRGDDYRISVDVDQSYLPGSADGFEVISGRGEAHGEVSGNTGLLAPRTSTTKITGVLDGEAAGDPISLSTRMSMSVSSALK